MLGIITRLNIFHSRNHILKHTIFRLLQRPFAKKSTNIENIFQKLIGFLLTFLTESLII